LTAKSYL